MPSWRRVVLTTVLAATCGGCAESSGDARSVVPVDEKRGQVEELPLGISDADLRRALGRGKTTGGLYPDDVGVPFATAAPPGLEGAPRFRRYEDRSFLLGPDGAFAIYVWSPDARSARGVAVGDELREVNKRYRSARCFRTGDREFGTAPTCVVRVGKRYLAFGEDPIKSITLTSVPVGK